MTDCLFCKIIAGQIPADKIYEDEYALAFLDIHPRAPGHVLIVPKRHMSDVTELEFAEVGQFFGTAQKIIRLLQDGLSPDGFTLGINHGKVAGQEVEHLHLHVLPRFANDGGASLQSVVHNPPAESTAEMAKKIKQAKVG